MVWIIGVRPTGSTGLNSFIEQGRGEYTSEAEAVAAIGDASAPPGYVWDAVEVTREWLRA